MIQEAAIAGDEDIRQELDGGRQAVAFERLLERYKEKVFHLALSMMRNPTVAEDMVQEIFVRIWKGLAGYNGQASLSTWIYTISRNTCLTELKKQQNRQALSLDEPEQRLNFEEIEALHTSDPQAGAEMDAQQLLEQLPEKYRQVITLFYLEQKSYEEVGALLGLPLGTVKTFPFRARQQQVKISRRHTPLTLATEGSHL